MRRALAAAVFGISLRRRPLARTRFALVRTVLDPSGRGRWPKVLYEDETVRTELAEMPGLDTGRTDQRRPSR